MISPGTLMEPVCPRIMLRRRPVDLTFDAVELDGDGLALALSCVCRETRLVFVLYKGVTGWVRFSLLTEVEA